MTILLFKQTNQYLFSFIKEYLGKKSRVIKFVYTNNYYLTIYYKNKIFFKSEFLIILIENVKKVNNNLSVCKNFFYDKYHCPLRKN